jgi:cell division protein FtsW (lipid II flippase)
MTSAEQRDAPKVQYINAVSPNAIEGIARVRKQQINNMLVVYSFNTMVFMLFAFILAYVIGYIDDANFKNAWFVCISIMIALLWIIKLSGKFILSVAKRNDDAFIKMLRSQK